MIADSNQWYSFDLWTFLHIYTSNGILKICTCDGIRSKIPPSCTKLQSVHFTNALQESSESKKEVNQAFGHWTGDSFNELYSKTLAVVAAVMCLQIISSFLPPPPLAL